MALSDTRATLEINLAHLHHNLHVLKSKSSGAALLAILKSNAYGHGLIKIAKALQTVEGLGVACLEEALKLRHSNIKTKIVVLQGCLHPQEYKLAADYELEVVIHHTPQLQWLLQYTTLKPLTIWLKINTGMNRLGFPTSQIREIWHQLHHCPFVKEVILISHLANADQMDNKTNTTQFNQFKTLLQQFKDTHIYPKTSFTNSASLLTGSNITDHWVRAGLALYGISPLVHQPPHSLPLRPVMTVIAKLIAVQHCKRGEKIGYYGRFTCPEDMRIGIISFGYGDGYPYNAPDGTPILLNGQCIPLIGQVSMDMLTVDLRSQPHAQIGDCAILWGQDLRLEKIARYTQRSTYELLCGMQREAKLRLQVREV